RRISRMTTKIPGSVPRADWLKDQRAGSTTAAVERTTSGQWHAQRLADELGKVDQDIDHRAEQIRVNYRSRTKAVANDHDLAPAAAERRGREAREQATEQMKQLRAEYAREREAAILTRQQVMLGTAPADASKLIAFRDSRARAETLKDADQAERAMRNAI